MIVTANEEAFQEIKISENEPTHCIGRCMGECQDQLRKCASLPPPESSRYRYLGPTQHHQYSETYRLATN